MTDRDRIRVAVIGGGKMGEAIVAGWVASDDGVASSIAAADVVVADPGQERRELLERLYGVTCVADASEMGEADVIVLAVKPQVMAAVLAGAAESAAFRSSDPLFVSIAAGLTTHRLEALLPARARLVRVMPNMALSVGAGASAVTGGSEATADDVALVAQLFGCLGKAVVVSEDLMDACCAVNGSGPAYVAAMIEALRDAGAAWGLPAETAEALALQTVLGTARLIAETGQSPEAVRESICSPGGTTLAALDAMNEAGFARVFALGVDAAVSRSKELAQC